MVPKILRTGDAGFKKWNTSATFNQTMSSALDNWSPSNRANCFRRFAQELKEESKRVFLKDKHHSEIFFAVTDDGQGGVMPAPPKMDRDEMVQKLKEMIQENSVYGIIHIVETWTYFKSGAKDHTMTQLMAGEIKVSELRAEDRDEALVVTMESREGAHFMWITPILREEDQLRLGETMNFEDRIDGRFGRLFSNG